METAINVKNGALLNISMLAGFIIDERREGWMVEMDEQCALWMRLDGANDKLLYAIRCWRTAREFGAGLVASAEFLRAAADKLVV